MGLIELVLILFIIFWVLGLIVYPWRGTTAWTWWNAHAFYMLLFALLGIALFLRSPAILLH